MGKSYWFLGVFLIVLVPIYIICFSASWVYNNYEYNKSLVQFNKGLVLDKPEPCLFRSSDFNVIYNEVYHLSNHNNILLIGSSTVVNGIVVHESTIPKNWDIHNMAIGGGISISEMMLMINYLNTYANHIPDKSDVIIIHISYASFKVPPQNERYVTQIIEAYGVYSIDKDLQVHGYMPDIYRKWIFSKAKITMALNSFTGINMFSPSELLTKLLKISNNITNLFSESPMQPSTDNYHSIYTYHSGSQIAEYKDFWTKFTRSITYYPNTETEEFKNFLTKLNTQTNIIVVNMYVPSWQKDIEKQKGYEEWTQSDLVPFLKENKIAYIDFSNSFNDEEYADSGHLNWAGREHFTRLFDDAVKLILSNISQSPYPPSED